MSMVALFKVFSIISLVAASYSKKCLKDLKRREKYSLFELREYQNENLRKRLIGKGRKMAEDFRI